MTRSTEAERPEAGSEPGELPELARDTGDPEPDDDDDEDVAALLRAVAHVSVRPDAAAPAPRRRSGDRVGDYLIEDELGAGGMGVVYVAQDTRLRRTVALKLLAPGGADEPDRKRRLLREARSASAVRHPNVATVYEVGESDGAAFIAMELARGESLRARIARGAMSIAEAVGIAIEIARALAAAHAVGVVHRDLKPDNVHVDGASVKVLDFGLAKRLMPGGDGAGASDQLTLDGRILGTPAYMAPEQIAGRSVDARADLWALGVILFEMLAGRRPFEGERLVDLMVAVSRDEAPPLRRLRREVPTPLARLVARLLTKEAAGRPASADEVIAELTAAPRSAWRDLGPLIAGAIAVVTVVGIAVASTTRGEVVVPSATPEPAAAAATPAATPDVLPTTSPETTAAPGGRVDVDAAPAESVRAASTSSVRAPTARGITSAGARRPPAGAPSTSARPRVDPLGDQK